MSGRNQWATMFAIIGTPIIIAMAAASYSNIILSVAVFLIADFLFFNLIPDDKD